MTNPETNEPADIPTAGTYATLDEAEAGQPRASVERLRELAEWGSLARLNPLEATIAGYHARTVLARLDELETLVADAIAEGDKQAKRAYRLQGQLNKANEQLQSKIREVVALTVANKTMALLATRDENIAVPREESDEDREVVAQGTRAYAHIVTSEARDLGAPEIVIMADGDDRDGPDAGDPIARWKLSAAETDVRDIVQEVKAAGWQPAPEVDWTDVQPGYWIVPVEKI